MPFYINQKEHFCDALVALMQDTNLEKITIQDIVDFCGVTRTTFYRYFKDKFELLAFTFSNEVDNLFQSIYIDNGSFWSFAAEVCYMMQKKEAFFRRAFLYEGQNSFFESVFKYCRDAVILHLNMTEEGKRLSEQSDGRYLAIGYAAAATVIFRRWILSGMIESPEEIARIICDVCPVMLKEYIK